MSDEHSHSAGSGLVVGVLKVYSWIRKDKTAAARRAMATTRSRIVENCDQVDVSGVSESLMARRRPPRSKTEQSEAERCRTDSVRRWRRETDAVRSSDYAQGGSGSRI